MKKVILIASCAVCFAFAANAQVDTTRRTQTPTQTPTQQQPTQSDQMRKDDLTGWTRVESADIPASLRTSFSADNKYQGWESGTIYRNENSDTYMLRSSGENGKSYYFDKNGKSVKKPNNKSKDY